MDIFSSGTSLQKVEFYHDNIKIDEDTESPYSTSWPSEPGDHSIYAIAYNNDGSLIYSPRCQVVVGESWIGLAVLAT